MGVHRRDRAPILDFRCGRCGRIFTAFTGDLHGNRRRAGELVLILRGIAQGVSTARLARDPDAAARSSRASAIASRRRALGIGPAPLDDPVVEADEDTRMRGKKGLPHRDRRPAEAAGQPGTRPWQLGEQSAAGVRGGRARERAGPSARRRTSDGATLEKGVRRVDWPLEAVNTDEWRGYDRLMEMGRGHATVCHAAGEWAATTTATGFARSTTIRWRACGRVCGTFCGCSAGSIRSTCTNTWRSSSGVTT